MEFDAGIERNNYIEATASRYHLTYEQLLKLVSQTGEQMGGMTKAAAPNVSRFRKEESGGWQPEITETSDYLDELG